MFELFKALPPPFDTIGATLVGVFGFIFAAFTTVKGYTVVGQGSHGIKLTFGRPVIDKKTGEAKVYTPRTVWLVPFFGSVELVDTREKLRILEDIEVQVSQFVVRRLTAQLTLEIVDPYAFRFVNENPLDTVEGLAREEILRRLGDGDKYEFSLSDDFVRACERYGVKLVRLVFTGEKPNEMMAVAGAIDALTTVGSSAVVSSIKTVQNGHLVSSAVQ